MKRRGFTLIEMLTVMAVIGIIVSLVLKASLSAYRVAEQKATIALIAKLEAALTDRVQALSMMNPEPTLAHVQLAGIWSSAYPPCSDLNPFASPPPNGIASMNRAQVIANLDNFRAELPDVFMVTTTNPSGAGTYPLNFAGVPCGQSGNNGYYLPLGASVGNTASPPTGTHGASFAVASGIYEQLGYGAKGIDGADNDGDGFIDDWSEGTTQSGLSAGQISLIQQRLANHKHNTARAEMLYAVLVHGGGPLGSSFNKDDFTGREVADTDNDGLLEFVDAWGQPIQFYRNPVLYHSDQQRGFPDLDKISADLANGFSNPGPYLSAFEAREVSPFDPNSSLLSPAWFASGSPHNNQGPPWGVGKVGTASGGAATFMQYFYPLLDPIAVSSGQASYQTYWDRSATTSPSSAYGTLYQRRAFYTRFLVVSGGPDKMPGVAMLSQNPGDSRGYPWSVDYRQLDERSRLPLVSSQFLTRSYSPDNRDGTGSPVALSPANLLIESQGGMVDLNRSAPFAGPAFSGSYRNDTNTLLEQFATDDITSQNYQSLGVPQ